MKIVVLGLMGLLFVNCTNSSGIKEKIKRTQEFTDYWYNNKAEITSYKLEQARYGEVHSGTAVLVFVT